METTTYLKTCRCETCGQWTKKEVEVEYLPTGTEVSVTSNYEDGKYVVEINWIDRDTIHSFDADNYADIRYLIQDVAFKLHNHHKAFVVNLNSSQYNTHRRVNSVSLANFLDKEAEATNRIDKLLKKYKRQDNYTTKLMMKGGI